MNFDSPREVSFAGHVGNGNHRGSHKIGNWIFSEQCSREWTAQPPAGISLFFQQGPDHLGIRAFPMAI